jgi:hypothetical protein
MEPSILELVGWIALGFVPTLVGLEIAWRTSTKRIEKAPAFGKKEKVAVHV